MSSFDLIALVGAVALGVGFLLGRFGEVLFVGVGSAVVVGALLAAAVSDEPLAPSVLLVAGLALLFFGLGIVRVMTHRSVSLRMLARGSAGGIDDEGGIEDIGSRLVDIERFGLASCQGGEYRLTAAGNLVAAVVASLYRVTGSRQ
jgi:hypothetical protein